MTAPFWPRDFVTELFLGDQWVDKSSMVHQPSGVTITRGAASEQSQSAPSSSKFTFYDPNDELNPDNPVGPHYEQIGQNVAVRQHVRCVWDLFDDRTVSNGWGSTPNGFAWSSAWLGGAVGDFSVDNNTAKHSVDSAAEFRISYLPGVVARNVHVRVLYNTGFLNVAGGAIEPANILLRGSGVPGNDTYYMIRVSVSATDQVSLAIHAMVGGSETVLAGPVTVSGLLHTSDSIYVVAAEVEDRTVRCKIWRPVDGEQFGWDLAANDVLNRIPGAGWVGVRSGVASGNTNTKPLVFDYDHFQVRKVRFQGSIYKLASNTDVSHKIKFVKAEGGGALRVLGRPEGAKRLQSAGRRYAPTQSIIKLYWSLEEGATAEVKGVPANAPSFGPTDAVMRFEKSFIDPSKGSIEWGGDTDQSAVVSAPQLTNGGRLVAGVPFTLVGLFGWSVAFGMRVDTGANVQAVFETTDSGQGYSAVYNTDGYFVLYRESTEVFRFDYDRAKANPWKHYIFMFNPVGGDTQVFLTVDGVAERATTMSGISLAPLNLVQFVSTTNEPEPQAVSSVAVMSGVPNAFQQADLAASFFGWAGETAPTRASRLCGEEGVPVVVSGDPTTSEPMGPQRPGLTLLTHLRQCEAVDMGSGLFEPLSEGVKFRQRSTVYNQQPRATLDYSADQVAEEFGPSRDDRLILNDVTAQRVGGGTYRHVVSSGPLGTDAVGTYDASPPVNVRADAQLISQAEWRTHLGTNPESRFPKLVVNLRAGGMTATQQLAVLDLDVLDKVDVTGLAERKIYKTLEQLVRGYTEVWGDQQAVHRVTFNTAPESGWHVGVVESAEHRASGAASGITAQLNSGATSMTVQSLSEGLGPTALWTTAAADLPLQVELSGEVMTVSNIVGASSPQTFTISSRNDNGLPVAGGKQHPVGTSVRLYRPRYAG